jgi:muramoyltetrapeptide carboxypeptidase
MDLKPKEKPWLDSLKSMLTGESIHYDLAGDNHNKTGTAQGILTGGNLAILAHLCGSVTQPDIKGKILFIEDVGEYIYSIDRMLLTLKRAGMFDGLAGLICGGFTELKDTERPFGSSIPELILEKISEYQFPVCFGFPAGHIEANYPIMLGKNHQLSVTKNSANIQTVSSFL